MARLRQQVRRGLPLYPSTCWMHQLGRIPKFVVSDYVPRHIIRHDQLGRAAEEAEHAWYLQRRPNAAVEIIASALGQALGAPLAIGCRSWADLPPYQTLGREADHLAPQIRVWGLLTQAL